MLKRVLLVCFIGVLMIGAAACSVAKTDSSAGTTAPSGSASAEDTVPSESGSFDTDDLAIVVAGNTYRMMESAADLLSALGSDYSYSEAESCVFEGMDKTFDFGDVLVYTVPSGETDLLDGFDIVGGQFQTSAGIGLGATREDVLLAYGEPADDSDYMIYNTSGDPEKIDEPRLTIVLDGSGVVEMISFYSGSNAQG